MMSLDESIRRLSVEDVAAIRVWTILLRWAVADWRNLVEFSRWRNAFAKRVELPRILEKEDSAIFLSVEEFDETKVEDLESPEAKRLSALLLRIVPVFDAVVERWMRAGPPPDPKA